MMKKKIEYNRLRTELDILESTLISFQQGTKTNDELMLAIKTFRKEIWKMI